MKYPKYVRQLKDSLHYHRDYPTRLKHLTSKKQFSRPLGLKVTGATDALINKAWIQANEAFDLRIKMIEGSDPDAFDQNELQRAVSELLRSRNLKHGQFQYYEEDAEVAKKERNRRVQLQPSAEDFAEQVIPEIEEVVDKANKGLLLDFEDKVTHEAYKALTDRAKEKPRTLSAIWKQYADHKQIDTSSRGGKRVYKYWLNWLAVVGDHVIAPNTLELIHYGLDDYVQLRIADGVKGSTIQRELSTIIACLRNASRKSRFGWVIEPPLLDTSDSSRRRPLNRHDQQCIVDYAVSPDCNQPIISCLILLELQGGMMPSEVGRLKPEDISLDTSIPFIIIRNETKTDHRKRVVPIVLGLDVIKANIDETITWISNRSDTTPSARVKKVLRTITESDTVTGHCLRHTFRANAEANQANPMAVAAIGGWSGSTLAVSDQMLHYGSEGIADSDTVIGLYNESRKIHKHLL